MTLTWRDLRSNFKIDLPRIKTYGSMRLDERNTMVSKLFPLALLLRKIFMNKHFPIKLFFRLVTSRTYSIRLTANLGVQIDSGEPGLLSFSYLTILLASR